MENKLVLTNKSSIIYNAVLLTVFVISYITMIYTFSYREYPYFMWFLIPIVSLHNMNTIIKRVKELKRLKLVGKKDRPVVWLKLTFKK